MTASCPRVPDEHYVRHLVQGLRPIEQAWAEINRGVVATGKPPQSSQPADELARSSAATEVADLYTGALAEWAQEVVCAFGENRFPTYCKQPTVREDRSTTSPGLESLTGTDDIIQAGLRAILWAAAYKDPALLIEGKEWYHAANYRNHIKKWIKGFVVRSEEGWRAHTELLDAIQVAFRSLAALNPSEDAASQAQGGVPCQSEAASQGDDRTSPPSPVHPNVFKKVGNTWVLAFGGREEKGLEDVKAMEDIRYLLARRAEKVDISELPRNRGCRVATGDVDVATKADGVALLREITELQHDERKEDNPALKREIQDSIKALKRQYNQNFDKHAEPRALAGDRRKMVSTTKRRFTRLLQEIKSFNPGLATHLKANVKLGRECSYNPEPPIAWDTGL